MSPEDLTPEEYRRIVDQVAPDELTRRKMRAALEALERHPEGLTEEELDSVLDGVT
jgi:hypothetical protein